MRLKFYFTFVSRREHLSLCPLCPLCPLCLCALCVKSAGTWPADSRLPVTTTAECALTQNGGGVSNTKQIPRPPRRTRDDSFEGWPNRIEVVGREKRVLNHAAFRV
jgi:hypothetical protein